MFKRHDKLTQILGVNQLKALIETASGLEYVGLAKNRIGTWDDVKEWLEGFGKFPITLEEVEAYRLKEKEKEVIVQKNQKVVLELRCPILITPHRTKERKVMLMNQFHSYILFLKLVKVSYCI